MILTILRSQLAKAEISHWKFLSFPVYRSLDQVLGVLHSPENFAYPQVKQLLEVASSKNLIKKTDNGDYVPAFPVQNLKRDDKSPFIVIEGLDGSGKTTLTELLRTTFNLQRHETPPQCIRTIGTLNEVNLRAFFEDQPETLKRAYYGMGNYLASKDVLESEHPIVMDRFWHSTTAYAFANFLREGAGDECYASEDLSWPSDLVQPNLVLFLTISEEERMRRHTNRADFTNTAEEKILASDPMFRENLKNCYKKISGVRFEEFPCEGPKEETSARLIKLVSGMFPSFKIN